MGDLFVPLVVAGALIGAVIAAIVNNVDLSLCIVIGVAAVLGAGYRIPLVAVMFVAEATAAQRSWRRDSSPRSPPSS